MTIWQQGIIFIFLNYLTLIFITDSKSLFKIRDDSRLGGNKKIRFLVRFNSRTIFPFINHSRWSFSDLCVSPMVCVCVFVKWGGLGGSICKAKCFWGLFLVGVLRGDLNYRCTPHPHHPQRVTLWIFTPSLCNQTLLLEKKNLRFFFSPFPPHWISLTYQLCSLFHPLFIFQPLKK